MLPEPKPPTPWTPAHKESISSAQVITPATWCKEFLLHIPTLDPDTKFNQSPPTMINITPTQLRKAANIQEKIQSLQSELGQILGGSDGSAAIEEPKTRKFSAYTRAKMRRAQQARWAKIKGTAPTTPAPKKKGKMSAAGRAAIRAAQIARWAKAKAAKVQKPKRKLTAAGRARLAALPKARWAKVKKSGKSRL